MSAPESDVVTAHDALHTPFRLRYYRAGYEPDQVDDFLDEAAAALRDVAAGATPAMTVADVFDITFTPTRFRDGYDQAQVDEFLDRVADTLEQAAS